MNSGADSTMSSTPSTNQYNYGSEICAKPNFTDDIFLYVLACSYLVIGVSFIICGYRCFKTSMFISGFTLAGFIVYLLCIQDQRLPQYGACIVTTCAALMFGSITMLIEFLGIFITGLQNGVLIGMSGMTTYNHVSATCIPTTYWLTTLIIILSGFTIACINISFKRGLTIISTSVCGGAFITISLDYLLHRGATVMWLIERTKLEPVVAPPCPLSWLLLALWPISAILGIIIQFTVTGTRICHEKTTLAEYATYFFTACINNGLKFTGDGNLSTPRRSEAPLQSCPTPPYSRATRRDAPEEISIFVPSPDSSWRRDFTTVRASVAADEFECRSLERWRGVQYFTKRLHAPNCPRFRCTSCRLRRGRQPDSALPLNDSFFELTV